MARLIGVDVGGTFTDVVVLDEGGISGRKVLTTVDQADGVARAAAGDPADVFLHGTTAATNALLQERGARVALITGAGYEDLVEIGRQSRPTLYDSLVDRPPPLVERAWRFGLHEDPEALLASVADARPEAVAIALLDAYADPRAEADLERRCAAALSVPVLRSSVISPEFREYERTATTVLSAYLTPSVAGYLASLDERLPMTRRLVMTSSGGLLPFSHAPASAGRLLLSGPAGGAVAAAALGRHHGHETVISFDMGGTSTDVSRISGGIPAVAAGHEVGGRINRVPAIPIRTIGAGGGSIGWLDAGGALRVGPHSAGAHPGPAAYGRGGSEPTVTDANLVAGHLPAELRLGGSVALDLRRAREALGRLGDTAGLGMEATAEGMLQVVDSHMEHALRAVSVEEGADPRAAALVAFGGAGGLHATRLARRLGLRTVLVPPLSGVFSALGLLLAVPRADASRTVMLAEGGGEPVGSRRQLEAEVRGRFRETHGHDPAAVDSHADVRYAGQAHELEVPFAAGWTELRADFEADHRQRFGFSRPDEPIELVNVRAVATGDAPLAWADLPRGDEGRSAEARQPRGRNGVWQRRSLPPGFALDGPAVVVEADAAVLLEAADHLTVLEDGTLEIAT